jgi:hypothetical protein
MVVRSGPGAAAYERGDGSGGDLGWCCEARCAEDDDEGASVILLCGGAEGDEPMGRVRRFLGTSGVKMDNRKIDGPQAAEPREGRKNVQFFVRHFILFRRR